MEDTFKCVISAISASLSLTARQSPETSLSKRSFVHPHSYELTSISLQTLWFCAVQSAPHGSAVAALLPRRGRVVESSMLWQPCNIRMPTRHRTSGCVTEVFILPMEIMIKQSVCGSSSALLRGHFIETWRYHIAKHISQKGPTFHLFVPIFWSVYADVSVMVASKNFDNAPPSGIVPLRAG